MTLVVVLLISAEARQMLEPKKSSLLVCFLEA